MSHIKSFVSFAIVQCRRFTQSLVSRLKVKGSTQPILNKYERAMRKAEKRHAALTCGYVNGFDSPGTLRREPLRGSQRAASRIARGVVLVIGITLCLPMSHASTGSINAINPKDYVRSIMPKHEAICLSRLIGKESAWNHQAIGNLSSPSKNYVYGLLQLKNPIVKDKSPIEQIHYGLRYINHRYQGSTCKAWEHWQRKGWH